MGAFCTRTICNIEKGDENYAKLIDRRNNMDAKNTNDVPENDEMPLSTEASPSPEANNTPKYTHATPNSSIMSVGDDTDSLIPSSPPKTVKKASSKHVSVPTPSIQEIQTAMDNMHVMFTPSALQTPSKYPVNTAAGTSDSDSDGNKEQTPTLPTMAFDVSNLQLANPFASPLPSVVAPDTVPEESVSHPIGAIVVPDDDNKDDANAGFMSSLPPIPTIPSERSADFNHNGQDIAAPANVVDKQPTLEDIFGGGADNGGQNDTFVIHGDEQQDAATKLQLQCEGSSGANNDTDGPAPAPAVDPVEAPGGAPVVAPGAAPNEVLAAVPDEAVKDEANVDKVGDVEENVNDDKVEDKDKEKEVHYKVNVEQVGDEENAEDVNDDEEVKEKQKSGGNLGDDAYKSDYETSEFESASSFDRGEHEDKKQKKNRGSKRRESKEHKGQQLLTLSYDETTLNSSSSDEDNDESVDETPRDGAAKKELNLLREKSRWKWQKREMSQHEKQIKAEIAKLKQEQEMAEMNNALNFYRQQSQQQ